MNLEAEDWKLNTFGQIIQSSYKVATLDFPSLYTSDANTAAVKNGVSVPKAKCVVWCHELKCVFPF
jgi:hypothetical protein